MQRADFDVMTEFGSPDAGYVVQRAALLRRALPAGRRAADWQFSGNFPSLAAGARLGAIP